LPDKKVDGRGDGRAGKGAVVAGFGAGHREAEKAAAPFITSQLQRDASSKLGFNVRRTMGVAQRLYEGVDIGAEGTSA
jgi:DNA topoisomerase-1